MKQYLDKQSREAEIESHKYMKQQQKAKEKKIEEMENEKKRKMEELMERHDRMFSWEDEIKKSEDAMLEGFRKQKEEIIAK